MIGSSAYVS